MRGLRVGVVGIPGKWSTETLADSLQSRTGFRLLVDMASVATDLNRGRLWHGETELSALDGLVVKKISRKYSPHALDRIELLRIAESAGVRVFSRTASIIRMIDRLGCTVTLRTAGIPVPATTVTEDRNEALHAVRRYGSAVFKPLYSTQGKGMCLIDDTPPEIEILSRIDAFRANHPMMYIQEKLDLAGRDFALVFLGGEYLGSYARIAQDGTWNTTRRSGGTYVPHEPAESTIELAAKAQALFEMYFTTVDLASTPDGPVVFEVSAFGGFRGAREGLGIDVASRYADYVVRELSS